MSRSGEHLANALLVSWVTTGNAEDVLAAVRLRNAPLEVLEVVSQHFPAFEKHYSSRWGVSTGFFEAVVDAISRQPEATARCFELLLSSLDAFSYPLPEDEVMSLGLISGDQETRLRKFLNARLEAAHKVTQGVSSGVVDFSSLPALNLSQLPTSPPPRALAPSIPGPTKRAARKV